MALTRREREQYDALREKARKGRSSARRRDDDDDDDDDDRPRRRRGGDDGGVFALTGTKADEFLTRLFGDDDDDDDDDDQDEDDDDDDDDQDPEPKRGHRFFSGRQRRD